MVSKLSFLYAFLMVLCISTMVLDAQPLPGPNPRVKRGFFKNVGDDIYRFHGQLIDRIPKKGWKIDPNKWG